MTYVVIVNVPGYMPMEEEPATFESWNDAVAYGAEECERTADFIREGYDWPEDDPADVYADPAAGYWFVTDKLREHDLGIAITVDNPNDA